MHPCISLDLVSLGYKRHDDVHLVLSLANLDLLFPIQVHEATALKESQEFKEGIVSQEVHRGFRLGNRLLRPATIKISTGPGKNKPTAGTEKSTLKQPQLLLE